MITSNVHYLKFKILISLKTYSEKKLSALINKGEAIVCSLTTSTKALAE